MLKQILKYSILLIIFLAAVSGSAYFTLTRLVKSRDIVTVPLLEGKEIVGVLELLTNLGLNIKVKGSEYNDKIPKNHVVFQEPEPFQEIKKGRDVRIILSKGPKTVAMPNLIGLSPDQARIIIEENDLRLRHISYTDMNRGYDGMVISQAPTPGSTVLRGDCTDLLVRFPARHAAFMMPDLTGMTLDEAIPIMEKHGMAIGRIKTVAIDGENIHAIVDQNPRAGFRVAANETFDLTVNQRSAPGGGHPMPMLMGPHLFVHRVDNGFLNCQIRLRLNLPGLALDLFEDFVEPGHEVWALVPSNRGAGLFLYENGELVEAKIYD